MIKTHKICIFTLEKVSLLNVCVCLRCKDIYKYFLSNSWSFCKLVIVFHLSQDIFRPLPCLSTKIDPDRIWL